MQKSSDCILLYAITSGLSAFLCICIIQERSWKKLLIMLKYSVSVQFLIAMRMRWMNENIKKYIYESINHLWSKFFPVFSHGNSNFAPYHRGVSYRNFNNLSNQFSPDCIIHNFAVSSVLKRIQFKIAIMT